MRLPRRLAPSLASVVAACTLTMGGMADGAQRLEGNEPTAPELTQLDFETLLATDAYSAPTPARRLTDAASAVSVISAEDIRLYGFQNLGDILDHMRGLHVSLTADYMFLGARGIGGAGNLAGRVLLLIDGIPANDNIFDQLYLGHDAAIDVALIDRVEYAPGSGSALYGNNALLGVINVVTLRGRQLDGAHAAASVGAWGDRGLRLSAGRREADSSEWLLSGSLHTNDGPPATELGPVLQGVRATDHHVMLKWRHQGLTAQWLSAERRVSNDYAPHSSSVYLDRTDLLAVGLALDPLGQWRKALNLRLGRYAYRNDTLDADYGRFAHASDGQWWSIEGQIDHDGPVHRIALGLSLRFDPLMRQTDRYSDEPAYHLRDQRRAIGLSAEDDFALGQDMRATLGLRLDRRTHSTWTWSPRVALVWTPGPDWTGKISHGIATRFASMSEQSYSGFPLFDNERVQTSEAVAEYRHGNLSAVASLYRYRVDPHYQVLGQAPPEGPPPDTTGHGAELEGEWQLDGLRLRLSQSWHRARAADEHLDLAPGSLTKFLASMPLAGERLRASLTWRHTSRQRWFDGTLPSRDLLDLTLVVRPEDRSWQCRVGVRNLLGEVDPMADVLGLERMSRDRLRHAWIEWTVSFP